VVAPRSGGVLAGGQGRQAGRDRRLDRGGEGFVVSDQDGLGGRVVLGLTQQIGGDPVRIVVLVGDHHDLGRARQGVDADHAVKAALGGGDEGVAGTDDLVDGLDRASAVSQITDCP